MFRLGDRYAQHRSLGGRRGAVHSRLLHDGEWNRCTLFDINFLPDPMSVEELRTGFHEFGRSFRIMKILVVIHIFLVVGYIFLLFFLGGIGILSELMDV